MQTVLTLLVRNISYLVATLHSTIILFALGVEVYPDTILKRYVDNQTFLQYPEIKIDYILALDTNWFAQAQDLFVNKDILEHEEVNRIKSQAKLKAAIEHVIASIPRDQLIVLVGDLVTDSTISTSSSKQNPLEYFVLLHSNTSL